MPDERLKTTPSRPRTVIFWLTLLLATAAILTTGYWAWRGVAEWDTEAMESPLILSLASQYTEGPGRLYGPFYERNHLVLIHAPLYYRAAAIVGWPLLRGGFPTIEAARLAGRGLSAISLLATLAIAYQLARLRGGSRLAGWWAPLLFLASPILAGLPFAVRPDMLGVALQSLGILLVLASLNKAGGSKLRLIGGYAAFGLALCVKQNLVVELAVCSVLLLRNRRAAGISMASVVLCLATCAAIVSTVYAAEWVITAGAIWQSAFVAAGEVGGIYPGKLDHLFAITYGLVLRESGFLALLALLGLTCVGFMPGVFRKLLIVAGTAIFSIIAVNFAAWGSLRTNGLEVAAYFMSLSAPIVFAGCCLPSRKILPGDRLDGVLWVCLAGEIAVVLVLSYLSTGAWYNYAIQAALLVSVIVARVGGRVIEALPRPRAAWPIAVGMLAVLLASYNHALDTEIEHREDQFAVGKIFETLKLPRDSVFFADYPGANRLNGRLDLVYDHWLYKVFEEAHLAPPRSAWIGQAMQDRSIRAVVALSDRRDLEGTSLSLPTLGFRPSIHIGRFYVWVR